MRYDKTSFIVGIVHMCVTICNESYKDDDWYNLVFSTRMLLNKKKRAGFSVKQSPHTCPTWNPK